MRNISRRTSSVLLIPYQISDCDICLSNVYKSISIISAEPLEHEISDEKREQLHYQHGEQRR